MIQNGSINTDDLDLLIQQLRDYLSNVQENIITSVDLFTYLIDDSDERTQIIESFVDNRINNIYSLIDEYSSIQDSNRRGSCKK